jgi:hypothetical protein
MSVLTIRIPESKHERLRNLAKSRGTSVNKLMEELSTIALAQHDAEVRFRAMGARGSTKEGLALLDKLDRSFARPRGGVPSDKGSRQVRG